MNKTVQAVREKLNKVINLKYLNSFENAFVSIEFSNFIWLSFILCCYRLNLVLNINKLDLHTRNHG